MSFSAPALARRAKQSSAVVALVGALPLGLPGVATAGDVFYSGRATALYGVVKLDDVRQSVTVSDNSMSCQGLPKNETLYSISRPGPVSVVADEAYTFTQGRDRSSLAKSRISGLQLDVPGLAIRGSAFESRAEATCDTSNVVTLNGKSTVGSLTINGNTHTITGQPNQAIEVPNVARITANYQTKTSNEVRVIALRVKLLDSTQSLTGDIYVSAARAKIQCE